MGKKTTIFVLVLLVFGGTVHAYDFSAVSPSGHTLYYNIVNGNVEVTRNPNRDTITGALIIPATVTHLDTTYTVTSIGRYAFANYTRVIQIGDSIVSGGEFEYFVQITSVTIPNTITSIGSYAFMSCVGLTSIDIPETVTIIDTGAFSTCTGLTSVNLPVSITYLGTDVFYQCSGLTSVIIPNSVPFIGSGTFAYCSSLTDIAIPSSVTYIGDWAFSECSGLVSVHIPNTVTYIDDFAFHGCSGLVSVNIPNSVTYIGKEAFMDCSLPSIYIPSSVTYLSEGAFDDNNPYSIVVDPNNRIYDSRDNSNAIIETATNALVTGCRNTIIPHSVTSIVPYAFSGCSDLSCIIIPNSVDTIGEGAFEGCIKLDTIRMERATPPVDNCVDIPSSTTIIVPCQAAAVYQSTPSWSWGGHIIREWCPVEVTALTSDSSMGIAMGGGSYIVKDTVVLKAITQKDFVFRSWDNGVSDNPYLMIVDSDSTVTAIFSPVDTIILHDTIYLYDTLYLHDTIYYAYDGYRRIIIYQQEGMLVVKGADGRPVMVYDEVGRLIAEEQKTPVDIPVRFRLQSPGVYIVKVGNAIARRIVVVK